MGGLRVLSLFSGAGGMDIGLHRAGFDTIGTVEIGQRQRDTLALNSDWTQLGNGDVNVLAASLKPEDLGLARGELDLLAGGPPCQPFSMAAQWAANGRRGMLDARAQTVLSTLELVRRFTPRAVLFENVRGFIQGVRSARAYLVEEFARIGAETGVHYRLDFRVVNAADYGVPQNRHRAIVVAIREEYDFHWPDSCPIEERRTAWDALWNVEPVSEPLARGKWTDLLAAIPEGRNYLWLTSKGGGPELFGDRTKYWNFLLKLARDAPSWTLPASPGPSTGPFHWDNRPLAIEEQLRLQGFPDGWIVAGTYREQTLQIGNATPALLAEVLGRALRKALTGEPTGRPTLLLPRAAVHRGPIPAVATLPERFQPMVGPKPPHAGAGMGPAGRASTNGAS